MPTNVSEATSEYKAILRSESIDEFLLSPGYRVSYYDFKVTELQFNFLKNYIEETNLKVNYYSLFSVNCASYVYNALYVS